MVVPSQLCRSHDRDQPHYTACGTLAHMAEYAPGVGNCRSLTQKPTPGEPPDGELDDGEGNEGLQGACRWLEAGLIAGPRGPRAAQRGSSVAKSHGRGGSKIGRPPICRQPCEQTIAPSSTTKVIPARLVGRRMLLDILCRGVGK